MRCLLILLLAVTGGSHWALEAQDAANGSKVIKDAQGVCQLTVPSDWLEGKGNAAFVQSIDGKLNAAPTPAATGTTFAEVAAAAKKMMPPTKVFEDSGSRIWFRYIGLNPQAGGNYYVAVDTNPVCTARITYKRPEAEETARKIALSLSAAPPK